MPLKIRGIMVMKPLTPEEMEQISAGIQQNTQFGPGLIARIVLGSLFFDFGADRSQLIWSPKGNA
jgi:hypothetical protein